MSTERPTSGLNHEQDQQLASLLSMWDGGPLSAPVFTQIARIIPQPIVEVVVTRINNRILEALLVPRPNDDIVWPGMLHTPGCALRASDYQREDGNPLNGAYERIQDEVGNQFAAPPTFVGRLHRTVERGPEVVEIYTAGIANDAMLKPGCLWYPMDELATHPKFIQVQLGHVNMVIAHFRNRLNQASYPVRRHGASL
ncbi:hypothetical protein HY386_02365 [Candidatus Daviesbacteria bacterium]|nr:hypothetical protein [Candidatus Daviesbacteria bacterium]